MRWPLPGLAAIALGGVVALAATDPKPVPEQIALGLLANLHQSVQLDHAAHVEIAGDCSSCHHRPFGEPKPCASCHDDQKNPSAFVHEVHWEVEDCIGCHHREATTDLRCVSCHTVEPDPGRLDVIGLKGAYHGLCMRCHGGTGSDTSCGLCHLDR
jgi:hypothetical protein